VGNSTQYSLPPSALSLPGNVKIGKVDLLIAGTEYSYALQNGLRQLEIYALSRQSVLDFRFSASGEYRNIPRATEYSVADINFSGKMLYIKSNTIDSAIVVEYY